MILLASDYLLFELESGEYLPFSADTLTVELAGSDEAPFDADFLEHATKAVFHFFRHELHREAVTVMEFSSAMEHVLRGFLQEAGGSRGAFGERFTPDADLCQLAEDANGAELLFFTRLRDELRHRLQAAPHLLRFRGLRGCVKQLAGVRRWSPRCQDLHDRIVEYLRACAAVDSAGKDCALVVE